MKFKLDGLKKIVRAIDKVEASAKSKSEKLIAGAGLRTVAMAKTRLQPTSDNRELAMEIAAVRQSINSSYDKAKNESIVFAGNTGDDHMAAYLEFGTGKHAAKYVPKLAPEFQELARSFIKTGKGTLKVHKYLIPAYLLEGKRLSGRLKNLKLRW